MLKILETACQELEAGRPCAMATIVFQQGSAPRGAGSRLLAGVDGLLCGTVGGGLAEAMAIKACARACQSGAVDFLEIAMDGQAAANADLICGGLVRILVEPFLPDRSNACLPGQLVAAIQAGSCRLVRPLPQKDQTDKTAETSWTILADDGSCHGLPLLPTVLADLARSGQLRSGQPESSILTSGMSDWFVEKCSLPERMILAGGGHVSLPTAQMAAMTGFAVHVLDDRPEFANKTRFANAGIRVVPDYANCFDGMAPCERDYIVIVTRGHLYDGKVLAQALQTRAGYIGMIGSSRKRDQIYAKLLQQGFAQSDLDRVHSPVGLAIGAETPEEIAVSIIGQCIAHRHRKAKKTDAKWLEQDQRSGSEPG